MLTLLSRLLSVSIRHRFLVVAVTLAVGALGAYNFTRLPIDAVPDITNVQVQINTPVTALSPWRSSARSPSPSSGPWAGSRASRRCARCPATGSPQVTVIFEDGTDIYWARAARGRAPRRREESLPPGLGEPQLGPIATGLGEIYMWTLEAAPDARRPDGKPYDLTPIYARSRTGSCGPRSGPCRG